MRQVKSVPAGDLKVDDTGVHNVPASAVTPGHAVLINGTEYPVVHVSNTESGERTFIVIVVGSYLVERGYDPDEMVTVRKVDTVDTEQETV